MSRKILTTCGTSLLTSNCWKGISGGPAVSQAKSSDKEEYQRGYREYARKKREEDPSGKSLADTFDVEAWKDTDRIAQLPAELASLKAICEFYKKREEPLGTTGDEIILLHSDNEEGEYCAEALKRVIEQGGLIPDVQINPWKIEGLDPSDGDKFGKALGNIWNDYSSKIKDEIKETNSQFILNLTGGYKGTTILLGAIVYKCNRDPVNLKIFYLHEKSDYKNIVVIGFKDGEFQAGYIDKEGEIHESFGGPMEFEK